MMRDPRRTRRVAVLTAAALILLVPAMVLAKGASTASSTSAAKSDDADFRASWKLAPGQTIEVKGVNGTIEATAASGNEVEVTASRVPSAAIRTM